MDERIIPKEMASSLETDFKLKDSIIFCQVSTIANGMPHIRTVRLYGIENEYGLIFLTRTTSRKWQDLKHHPHLAVCILHPETRIQLQAECTTTLICSDNNPQLVKKYWSMVRMDVKKIYHDDYVPNVDYQQRKETDVPPVIPTSFGMIMAMPHQWEYLLVNDNYPDSIRYQFNKNTQEKWVKLRLTMS